MERNSVIVERLEKPMIDKLPRTSKYDQSFDEIFRLENDFKKLIGSDERLVKMFLEIESLSNSNNFEYESMCFCEGVRLGFKLCMDIFEL